MDNSSNAIALTPRTFSATFSGLLFGSKTYEELTPTSSCSNCGIRYYRLLGKKQYELSNHLGNVISTISDRRLQVDNYTYTASAGTGGYIFDSGFNNYIYTAGTRTHTQGSGSDNIVDSYTPDVLSNQDYYAFGAAMPGRGNPYGTSYRYGFNGKENDKEVVSSDNGTQDYGMRIYNPSLGKFLSVDPLTKKYPELTPYQYASNRPIVAIDRDGMEAQDINPGIETLVIVVQGYGHEPANGATQVDNAGKTDKINSRDNGLGWISADKLPAKSQVVTFASSPQKNTEEDVLKTVKDFKATNPSGKVILVGHSLGGYNVTNVTQETMDIKYDLVITVDPSGADYFNGAELASQDLYENVQKAINYRSTEVRGGTKGAIMDFSSKTEGANIVVPGVGHTNIDNTMAPYIIGDIWRVILGVDPVKAAEKRDMSTVTPVPNDPSGGGSSSCD